MGKKFLIDTNVLIDAQTARLPEKGLNMLADIINKDFTVSFITYIEFLGYKAVTKASQDFISLSEVIEVDKAIIEACIALRKARKIKLPDAIIAATAIAHQFTLVTNNEKDFIGINELETINLHKL